MNSDWVATEIILPPPYLHLFCFFLSFLVFFPLGSEVLFSRPPSPSRLPQFYLSKAGEGASSPELLPAPP